jgi:GNAT superfamily N-acetyltransferase
MFRHYISLTNLELDGPGTKIRPNPRSLIDGPFGGSIMNDQLSRGGTVRKLWSTEKDKFRDHLLRLDGKSRHMRFAHAVSDSFIVEYASRMTALDSIAFGYVVDGQVRAAAELRKLAEHWGRDAEAAFSVEPEYQNQGIGSELMSHVIRAARNRGVLHLYMSCLADNRRMQSIARKHVPSCASNMEKSSARSCRWNLPISRSSARPSKTVLAIYSQSSIWAAI